METFLSFLPLIIITLFIGFGSILIIDDARRQAKRKPNHKKN